MSTENVPGSILSQCDREIVYSSFVEWLPDLSAVNLKVVCKYKHSSEYEVRAKMDKEMLNVGKQAKQAVLQEICDESIRRKMWMRLRRPR